MHPLAEKTARDLLDLGGGTSVTMGNLGETNSRRSALRQATLGLGVVLGLLLAGLATFTEPLAASPDRTHEVRCEPGVGEPVLEALDDVDQVLAVPYVEAARCTWLVSLVNSGWLPVTVTDITLDQEPDRDRLLTFETATIAPPATRATAPPPSGVPAADPGPMRSVTLWPGEHAVAGLTAVMGNCERRRGEVGTEFHHTWPVKYRALGLVPRTTHVRVSPHLGVALLGSSCQP